jgi:hypothetical protein
MLLWRWQRLCHWGAASDQGDISWRTGRCVNLLRSLRFHELLQTGKKTEINLLQWSVWDQWTMSLLWWKWVVLTSRLFKLCFEICFSVWSAEDFKYILFLLDLMANMNLLLIFILLLSHSFIFFRFYFFINTYIDVFLFNTVIYVFLLLCLCILIVCLCIFIMPTGTLRLPWLRFFRVFSSVVRQMPG